MEIKALIGQSLIDLSIQTSGSPESVFELAIANGMSVTDSLTPGQEIACVSIRNKKIFDYYQMKGLTPTTAVSGSAEQREGIGFWAVERYFVVS